MSGSHFDRPLETIQWAKDAINELHPKFASFLESKPYGHVINFDPKTGNDIHKFKLMKPFPSDLRRHSTDALNHCRHAFDQALYAGCMALGRKPVKNFPWSMNPLDLQNKWLNKGLIPNEFHDIIKRQEPYPTGDTYTGGEDGFRALAKLANTKHSVGITTSFSLTMIKHPTYRVINGDLALPMIKWDPVNNEAIIAITKGNINFDGDYRVTLDIAFDEPPPLRNVPISIALTTFADKAEGFTKQLQARCAEVLSNP